MAELERAGVRFETSGLQEVLNGLKALNKALIDVANQEKELNKAAKGGIATDNFTKMRVAASDAAKQFYKTGNTVAQTTGKIVAAMTKESAASNALKIQQTQLAIAEERTALVRAKAAAAAAVGPQKYLTQQQAVLALQTQLQIAQQRTAQITVAANAAIQLSQGKTTVTTERLAAMFAELAAQAAGATGGGTGGGKPPADWGATLGGMMSAFPSITGMITALTSSLSGGAIIVGLMGIVTWAGKAALSLGKAGLAAAVNIAKTAFNLLLAPIKAVTSALASFVNRVMAVAVGVMIRDVIFGIMRAMKQLVTSSIDAAATFQTLQIRLENLISREARTADATISVADAMSIAGGKAQLLSEWIKNLSLRIPFDVNSIANTQAFGMAMGFSAIEAKTLTDSVLNFSAAMGLGSDVTERIIFNFGQMKQQGKVTSTEMRDLARGSFFPLSLVLQEVQKGMGGTAMSFSEVKKAASEGKIPIDEFFNAFNRVVARDFPNAVERMAQTFIGAKTLIGNFFKTVLGGDILGPTIAKIGKSLASLFDPARMVTIRNGARQIGLVLVRAFTDVMSSINSELIPALGELAKAFGIPEPSVKGLAGAIAFLSTVIRNAVSSMSNFVSQIAAKITGGGGLQGIATKMYTWGYNIVAMFAKGMAAAVNLIVMIINAITRILNTWFSTHSPPKVAPNIDKWGADTMTEWLKGWLKADFSIFNDITDKIESFLRSIPGGIGKDNKGLVPAILGARAVVAQAINSIRGGFATVQQAIDRLMNSIKRITPEFKDYFTALFSVEAIKRKIADASKIVAEREKEVAAAVDKVKQAQIEITAIEERRDVIQKQISATTDRYNKIIEELRHELEKVTDVYDEQRRLQEINQAIGTGLLTQAEKERLEMEKRSIEIEQQIRDTEDVRDSAVAELEAKIALIEIERVAAEARVKAAEAEKDAAQARVDAAQKIVDAAEEELAIAEDKLAAAEAMIDMQIEQNKLIQEQMDLLEQLAKAAAGAAGGAEDIAAAIDDLGLSLDSTTLSYSDMARAAIDNPMNIGKVFEEANKAVAALSLSLGGFGSALAPLTGPGGAFTKLVSSVGELVGFIGGQGKEGPVERALRFEKGNVKPIEEAAYAVKTIADAITNFPETAVFDLIVKAGEALGKIPFRKIGEDVAFTIGVFGNFFDKWNKDGFLAATIIWMFNAALVAVGQVVAVAMGLVDEAFKRFTGFDTDLRGLWTTLWTWVIEQVQLAYDAIVGKSIIPDLMTEMYDLMTTGLDSIWAWIRDTWVVNVLKTLSDWVLSIIGPSGIVTKFLVDLLTNMIVGMVLVYLDWEARWDAFWQKVEDIFNGPEGIVAKVSTALDTVAGFFKPGGGLWTAISGFINGVLTDLINKIGDAIDALLNLGDEQGKLKTGTNTKTKCGGPGQPSCEELGGQVYGGRTYMVGEVGPELFVPPMPGGSIIPTGLTERIIRALKARVGVTLPAGNLSGGGSIVSNTYNIEISPSYRNVQSEASLFYDVTAALAAVRR